MRADENLDADDAAAALMLFRLPLQLRLLLLLLLLLLLCCQTAPEVNVAAAFTIAVLSIYAHLSCPWGGHGAATNIDFKK